MDVREIDGAALRSACRDFARRREQAQCLGEPKPYYNTSEDGFAPETRDGGARLRWMLWRDDDERRPKGRHVLRENACEAQPHSMALSEWEPHNKAPVPTTLFFDHSAPVAPKLNLRAGRVGPQDQPHPRVPAVRCMQIGDKSQLLHPLHVCPPDRPLFV